MLCRANSLSPLIAAAVALSILASCSKTNYGSNSSATTPAASGSVAISNFAFSPSTITIKAGEKVKWMNNDNVNHTVTADSGAELDSPLLGRGSAYEHTFASAGTFTYHCSVHTTMKGTVIVQ